MLVDVAKLVGVEADDSPAPTLWRSLLSLPLLYWGTFEQMVAGRFSSINHFDVLQIYKWLHNFFWGIFTIHDSVYERDTLATGCLLCQRIDCLAGFCRVFTFNFIRKQVKIESWKAPRGEKSPKYEVSENNFRFDESIVP